MLKSILSLIMLVLLATSCTQKLYSPSVVNNSTTEEGTIRINARGLGVSLASAYNNAVENAFSMLLFKGIPESIQTTPLIPDEAAAKQQHPEVLECFKNKSCYSQFLTKASQEGQKEKVQGGYQVSSDVTINIRALRTYLEQKNTIRKFGY